MLILEPVMWLGEQGNTVQSAYSITNYDSQKIRRLGKQNSVCLTYKRITALVSSADVAVGIHGS